jgi:hypothetical protein
MKKEAIARLFLTFIRISNSREYFASNHGHTLYA